MNKLYIIPTPVGNLEDITLRAVRLLKESEIILSEDTRKSKILLNHYGIKTKLVSHHKYNEHRNLKQIIDWLQQGTTVSLISEAGTPAISDPGFLLIRECIRNGIEVECLPGPTAFVPALVNSGLPADKFCFEGFLPAKKGRLKRLSQLAGEERTIIFYESPFRLLKTLKQLAEIFGNTRNVCVSRELTKIHEENIRGSLEYVLQHFTNKPVKGEIVIVVGPDIKN